MRNLVRWVLTILLIGSLSLSGLNIYAFWQNPTVMFFAKRSVAEIESQLQKTLATEMSAESFDTLLSELLDEDPRDWLVIESVESVAAERQIFASAELQQKRETAYDADHGFWIATGKCVSCAWNATSCELSAVLICRAPIDLTPVGDIIGVVRESKNYVLGNEVDMFELGLSTAGLASVVIAPLTGGSSATIKIGASLAKTARRMGRISRPLLALMTKTFRNAIDWQIIAGSSIRRFTTDVGRAVRSKPIQPAMTVIHEMAAIRSVIGIPATLHLLKNIDSARDAQAISGLVAVTKNRTVGILKILGKSKIVKITLRYGDEVIALLFGFLGMIVAILGLFGSLLGTFVLKRLRRIANPKKTS